MTGELRALARQLADLHVAVDPAPAVAGIERTARLWRDNAAELLAHGDHIVPRAQVERIAGAADTYLRGRGALWEQRAEAGRVRDGHGDLLADDVFCLPAVAGRPLDRLSRPGARQVACWRAAQGSERAGERRVACWSCASSA